MTGENLADLRIRVEPGGGVVAVLGGVLLVIPTISAGQDDAVDALLAAAVTPGVVRAVARVVADFDEERIPPFSLVVEGGLGPMFALVHGEVVLHAIGSADEVRLAGREARSWVDRTLPGGVERLSVLPQDAEPGPGDAYSDLRAGVVRGAGVLVTRREPEVASQPEPSPDAASQPEPSPEAAPEPELQPQPEPQPDLQPEPRSDPAPEQVLDPEVSFGSGAAMPADAGAEAEEPVVAVELPVEQVEPLVEQVEEAEPSTRDEQAHLSDDVPADVGVPEQHQDVGVPEQHQTGTQEQGERLEQDEQDEQHERPAAVFTNGSAYPGRHSAPEWSSAFPPPPPPVPVLPPPPPPPPPPGAQPFPTQGMGVQPPIAGYGGLQPAPVPAAFDPFAQIGPRSTQDTLLHEPAMGGLGPGPGPGRLVLQDGHDVLVDRDCVIGRNPEADPDVARGRAKAVVLPDAEQRISRVHARLILSNGAASIVDQGSVNGTWIEPPGTQGWIGVDPDVPAPLPIGTRIQVGDAVLSYTSAVHA